MMVQHSLDCSFKHRVNGLIDPHTEANNNGGHFHDYKSRAFTYKNRDIEYSADTKPDKLIVEGLTLSTPPFIGAYVIHYMPSISGNMEVESFMTLPNNWYCIQSCYTNNTWRYLLKLKVGIKNLEKLPIEKLSDSYIRFRGDPSKGGHPFEKSGYGGYYGAVDTIRLLPLIATDYLALRGKKLSVNDIGLIAGGHFDIFGKWLGDHKSHREGKDVDINKSGKDCLVDLHLHLATDMHLPTLREENGIPTPVLCEEPTGNKHIDFELSL